MSYQIESNDYQVLNDALYDLNRQFDKLDEVLNPLVIKKLRTILSVAKGSLHKVNEQKRLDIDRKLNHYQTVKELHGFKSEWSIYSVNDLYDKHNFPKGAVIRYVDHWGDNESESYPINGDTWIDVYHAADQAIQESNDCHHVFIEEFSQKDSAENSTVFYLRTGS